MALVLSGSIDISGSMTATTILISSPGAAGMVSSSAQITELAPLMAYTASIKGAAIVSSSQQVQNYFTFAKTGSANTFYGTQTISGDIKAISNTNSNLKSVQLGTAVNGTGGGNRIFDGSFTGTTNSFTGVDAVDQGYGYFPATIVSGNTYTLFFKSVETNCTLGTIITSTGTNFATSTIQTLTLPSVTNGVYNTVTFTASASATHIGFAGYPTTGTITLTISEVSLVEGTADTNIGKLIVQRSLVANGDSMFNGNVTASGNLHANQLYIGGATTASGLFGASEAVVQNELGIQSGDATGTYMRLIANAANSNTAIVAGAFSGAAPPLDLIAGGVTGISVKNDGGVDFVGSPTASIFKIKTAGGGIDFSVTSNGSGTTSSELLNDYEEGTWTPTIRGSGTAGTYELATDYTTYTKIGRQVTLNGQIKLGTSVTGGGTGYLQILGAPFTKAASTVAAGAVVLSGINFTGDFVSISFASLGATTTIFLPETVDNASSNDLPISAAVANATIQFTITYFV